MAYTFREPYTGQLSLDRLTEVQFSLDLRLTHYRNFREMPQHKETIMKTIAPLRWAASPRILGFLFIAALLFAHPPLTIAQNIDNTNTNRAGNLNGNNSGNNNGNTTDNTGNNNTGKTTTENKSGAVKTPPCPAPDTPSPKVTNVYKETNTQPTPTPAPGTPALTETPGYESRDKDVALGDVIVVEGDNFKTLLDQAICEKKNLVLYLDGRPLIDVTAFPPTDPNKPSLKFTLKRTEKSRDVWTYILGQPTWNPRRTKVSIGIVDKYAIDADEEAAVVNLVVIPKGRFISWLIFVVLLFIGFIILAAKSNLLRDSSTMSFPGKRGLFSLARAQAAWWFFLVLSSYLFIGIITGDFGTTITGTVLGLLGISAGTAVGSAMIDANKSTPEARESEAAAITEAQTRLTQLDTDIAAAKAALAANADDATVAQTLASKMKEKEDKISQLKKMTNQSENFVLDILSDVNGVSFHRFQIAAWTLVLGIIFITQVYKVLAMPDFDGSLLALLGISAGTFVGLKIPEATVPKK
jgi:hypothetical protein